ncbi:MAG: ATP-grasp domain-containing protein [Candidatus Gastranaerophilales bacterium]|nr:ATP-grasp domain-containing protein [Candidatus Gastranaerophilales bacterium]
MIQENETKKLNILFHSLNSTTQGVIRQFKNSAIDFELFIISKTKDSFVEGKYIGDSAKIRICELKNIIKDTKIDFVVCLHEGYSDKGLIDFYKNILNVPIIGCNSKWMKLETSKFEGKKFFIENKINTPEYEIISNIKELDTKINKFGLPIVIKYNSLKAGFGSYICKTKREANKIAKSVLKENDFCIVEEFIKGNEISVQYIWDENNLIPLNPVKDFKKSSSKENAVNTGGMGCYTPVKLSSNEEILLIEYNEKLEKIFIENKVDFTGIFTANLLFTDSKVYTLEFNMRPGITEFETLIENMDCDLLELFWNTANKRAKNTNIKYKDEITGCVNVAHKNYLKQKSKKRLISIDKILRNKTDEILLNFLIGSLDKKNRGIIDENKRFLSVICSDKINPFKKIYKYIKTIKNRSLYYRKDIGV